MIKIAVYGKGGIGKSTTVSNLAAALRREGPSRDADRLRPEGGLHDASDPRREKCRRRWG